MANEPSPSQLPPECARVGEIFEYRNALFGTAVLCDGESSFIERYLSSDDLAVAFGGRIALTDNLTGKSYLGVWGRRNAKRFRRLLRERGATFKLIRGDQPERTPLRWGTSRGHRLPTNEPIVAMRISIPLVQTGSPQPAYSGSVGDNRDSSEDLPELLGVYKRDGYFFGVVRIRVEEQVAAFEFGVSAQGYSALRRMFNTRPFDATPGLKYRYFFTGGFAKPGEEPVPFQVRIEQGRTAKSFEFHGPAFLVANLLWFKQLKTLEAASALKRVATAE